MRRLIEAVLDASAVLALLRNEPGAEIVSALLPKSAICTVNLAEVISTLVNKGASAEDADMIVADVFAQRVSADEPLARRAGTLRGATMHLGLSLGDRFCLALAEREGVAAVTADKTWDKLAGLVKVTLVR